MSAIASVLLLAATSVSPPPAMPCAMQPADRQWLDGALAAWPDVERRYLKGPARDRPTLIVYDRACRYVVLQREERTAVVEAAPLAGNPLPGSGRMRPGPNAVFNQAADGANSVVIALPSVWEGTVLREKIPLGWVIESALFHELTHAYQAAAAPSGSFHALLARGGPMRSIHDDTIQDAFARDPSYAGLVSYERMLLAEVATAPNRAEAQRKACEAAQAIAERRRRLSARTAPVPLAEVDEIANTSEGLANWVAFRWLSEDRGVPADAAVAVLGGRSWSQIIGLATMRALDRVSPGWEGRLLSEPPASTLGLLEEACRSGG